MGHGISISDTKGGGCIFVALIAQSKESRDIFRTNEKRLFYSMGFPADGDNLCAVDSVTIGL
jgi:hypothetical protein